MTERTGRLLVVEDDATIRGMILDALELDGYEVRGARDGEDALCILEGWAPDLIILDLMMPRLDAWGFREEQRKRRLAPDVPVIVLSAGRDLEARTAALDPVAIIPKPFDLEDFLETVQRLAGSRRD